MPLNDIDIAKENGLNREAANEDRTSCLLCGGITAEYGVDGVTAINTLIGPFYAPEDAEAVGITKEYDAVNGVLVHNHITEHFRGFGESIPRRAAKPLYLYMVSQSTPLSVMCDKDEEFSAYAAARASGYKIKRFSVALNPDDLYTPDIAVNGFDADVALAVAKAQATADALYDEHGAVDFYIECRDFNPAIPGAAINVRTLESENISLVIVQDYDVAQSNALHNGYAAVGTILGLKTSKPTVADSFAEVGQAYQGNIQDIAAGKYLRYGFGNKELKDWSLSAQNAFYDKGYVAVRVFAETSGVYVTQSFTCAVATSDYDREELNAVHNKAHRGLYRTYVPYTNTKFKLTDEGYIPGDVAKEMERKGNRLLQTMADAGEISNGKTYIDPLQRNAQGVPQSIAITRVVKVKWKMIPQGKQEGMEGELSFVTGLD